MQTVLLISLGAIIGANLRYFVAQYVTALLPSSFPFGTLIINISASFVLGFFLIWTTERVLADPQMASVYGRWLLRRLFDILQLRLRDVRPL